MGGQYFTEESIGKTAEIAFVNAVKSAQWDYGHSGYTGTIAEKVEFHTIDLPPNVTAREAARWIRVAFMHGEEHTPELLQAWAREWAGKVLDKWGPCGCIKVGENEWLFFGWASS